MDDLYYVRSTTNHFASKTGSGRSMQPKGSIYKLPYDLAMRKQRVGHVELIGPVETTDLSEVLEDDEYHPDMEQRVPEGPTETKEESPSPEDLVEQRGDSSWYDVEGYEDGPVQGYDAAIDAAEEVLN